MSNAETVFTGQKNTMLWLRARLNGIINSINVIKKNRIDDFGKPELNGIMSKPCDI